MCTPLPPPPFICSSTVHSILLVIRVYSRSLPRTLSQMHIHLFVVCFYHFSANCEHTACLAACGVCRSFPNLFVLSNVGRGGVCGSSKLKKGWLNTPLVVLLFFLPRDVFFFSCALPKVLFLVLSCVRYIGSLDLPLHTC